MKRRNNVERVLEVKLAALLDPTRYGVQEIGGSSVRLRAPYIADGGYRIWGATCMMLAELAALLRELVGGPL